MLSKKQFFLMATLVLISTSGVGMEQQPDEYPPPDNQLHDLDDELDDDVDDEAFDMENTDFAEIAQNQSINKQNTDSFFKHPLITAAHLTVRQEFAYGIEEPQQLLINRSSLRLQWEKGQGRYFLRFDGNTDMDFVYNRNEFSQELKNKYQHQSDIREFYLQASEGPVSIKLGRQLVTWGKADGAVVTDIMSPRDLTESVFTSVENARLGQTMLVADLYLKNNNNQTQHQWSLVLNPDIKVNEYALPGHPYGINLFANINTLPPISLTLENNKPATSLSHPEVGLRWNATQNKVDWSLMAADVYEDTPILLINASDFLAAQVTANYPRYQMLGGGFNWGKGSFVWKGEIAFKKNRSFNQKNLQKSKPLRVWDTALGFDYNANGAYTISLELTNQHIIDWTNQLLNLRRDESLLYATWNKTWLNETLTTQYTSSVQLQDGESFHRIEFQYDISDQVSTEFQIDYFDTYKNNSLLGRLEDKHRVSWQVSYDF